MEFNKFQLTLLDEFFKFNLVEFLGHQIRRNEGIDQN